MRVKSLVILIVFIVLNSCNYQPVHPSLWLFRDYSKRFQPVLDVYQNPNDSLKRKAAEFLIQHMDDHFYYQSKQEKEIDTFIQQLDSGINLPVLSNKNLYEYLRCEMLDNYVYKNLQNGNLSAPEYQKLSDIKTLDPKFIIENIEYAFKAWEFPWARSYNFDEFCKYILPYRYGNEPPSSWRKTIFEQYQWLIDSLKNEKNPQVVADFIHQQFNHKLSNSKAFGGFHLSVLNNFDGNVFTSCVDQAGMGISIFRALGIPATVVQIPNWGNRNYGHHIIAMPDHQKKWHYYNFGYPETEDELNYVAPKMFFMDFDKMHKYKQELVDASEFFMEVSDLEIEWKVKKSDEVYLYVFGNLKWMPLGKGEQVNSKVKFKNVGNKNTLFKASAKSRFGKKEKSVLFYTDSKGKVTLLKPDKTKLQTVTLSRKYIYQNNTHLPRIQALIGGKFFVADNPSFLPKTEIYSIDSLVKYDYNMLKCKEQKGKFVRYEFPESALSSFDGPAEIAFYTTVNNKLEKLNGEYFSSPNISKEHLKIISDENVLSFVEVWDCDEKVPGETGRYILRKNKQAIFVGMELDSAVTITHVGICPRNDKNGIYPGMKYELFMWDDEWKSMGVKVATANTIRFNNIPENALLWLRNLDEGKEERIFILKNGEQVWW